MNWYYEHEGVSQGPHNEAQMSLLVMQNRVATDCLLWHPGLEEWRSLRELNPAWLRDPVPATTPAPKPARQSKSEPPADDLADEKPPVPPGIPASRRPNASQEPPMETMLKPRAPSPTTAAAPEKKPGLLKRLFGGKK